MISRRYTISILALVILLALTPIGFIWVWQKHYMIVTLVCLAILWITEIFYLFYLLRKNIRELRNFLTAFEYNDSAIKYSKPSTDPSLKGLYSEFDRIIEAFQDVKIKKERELQFFKLAAEHAGVGLIAFSTSGEIKLINIAFTELFNLSKAKYIHQLVDIDEKLSEFFKRVEPGKEILKLFINNQLRHIAAKTVLFSYEENEYKLIAFQDIKNEIDQTELDAWQKLIRILRHEIHNSLSPITFLSSGLIQQIKNNIESPNEEFQVKSNDILEGLEVIRKRSISLSEFVENYKRLTDIPLPNIQPIEANKIISTVEMLFKDQCLEKDIALVVKPIPINSIIHADEKLFEQALINLIGNAIDATSGKENAKIVIEYNESNNSQSISITDNGHGLLPELFENIFTPFFTTKKNGSGIGLSLSRQIIRLHNGTLTVKSSLNNGTTFYLTF